MSLCTLPDAVISPYVFSGMRMFSTSASSQCLRRHNTKSVMSYITSIQRHTSTVRYASSGRQIKKVPLSEVREVPCSVAASHYTVIDGDRTVCRIDKGTIANMRYKLIMSITETKRQCTLIYQENKTIILSSTVILLCSMWFFFTYSDVYAT
eukprot:Tbor_TRINITY_DN3411_c0_g3::TRINITY_DN3411_c0_g3_i1::g.3684::m.3684